MYACFYFVYQLDLGLSNLNAELNTWRHIDDITIATHILP